MDAGGMIAVRHFGYRGLEAVMDFAVRLPLTTCGSWRHLPVSANGQAAVASYLLANGSLRTTLASRGRVHYGSDGKPVGVRGVSADISGRRQAEQDLVQKRNELAHLSRVTTVSELSGSLAHELNQPLGIILSNAQAAQELLLQDPPMVREVSDILADIVAADRRAAEIIQRLRALLKRGEVSLQSLQLNDLLEEVLRLVNADLIGRIVAQILRGFGRTSD